MQWIYDRGLTAGAVTLVVSAVVLGASLTRALRSEPAPVREPRGAAGVPVNVPADIPADQVPAREPTLPSEQHTGIEPVSSTAVQQAANRAPFDPERQPPRERYRLPGADEQVPVLTASPELPPVPALRVLGTISGAGGGVAVIQAAGDSPKIVSVGQTIGGYRLAAVREEAVTVASGDFEIELSLETGTATAEAESQNPWERGSWREQQNMEAIIRAMQERLGTRIVMGEDGRAYAVGEDGSRREIQLPGMFGGRGGRGGAGRTVTSTRIPPASGPGSDDDMSISEGGYRS